MKNLFDLILDSQKENYENRFREVQENECFLKMVNSVLELLERRKGNEQIIAK